jgi:adenylate kinase
MQSHTVIFMGPQGSGKGTQVELLRSFFQNQSETPIFHFATGDGFRSLMQGQNYTSTLVAESMDKGELQPLFLTVWMWGGAFVESLRGDEHMLIDGYPRTLLEAEVLESALHFYKKESVTVIHLQVSDEESKKRMQGRGRADDHEEAITKRLEQYHQLTKPILDYYEQHPRYSVITIDGEKSIQEIHQDIQLYFKK